MKDSPLAQAQDKATLASARELCTALDAGLPQGEIPETIGEFVDVHVKALEAMRQQVGKGSLIISLEYLSRQYPFVPVEEKLLC